MSKYKIDPLVMIGVPTLMDRPLSWEWMDQYAAMTFPLGCSVARFHPRGMAVAEARNAIVEKALNANAQYVLFISDDVLAPPRTFERLWQHRKDIVTGVYWTKYYPMQPYIWKGLLEGPYTDWKAGEFFEIDWAGCDCLLVNTDVFRKMEYPWFSHDWNWGNGEMPTPVATEDLYFYTKAKKLGYKIWCDSGIQCEHQDRNTHIRYGLRQDMPQYENMEKDWKTYEGKKLIADVGCGKDTPYFGADCVVHRIDMDPKVRPDIQCDVRKIPVPSETYDIVHARHVLEHFPVQEAGDLIKEWVRILKIDGELIISVPNLAFAAKQILMADKDPNYDSTYAFWQIYGRHETLEEHEFHKCGYTRNGFERLFNRFPELENVEVKEISQDGINLEARAIKTKSSKPLNIIKEWYGEEPAITLEEGNGWEPQPSQQQPSGNS